MQAAATAGARFSTSSQPRISRSEGQRFSTSSLDPDSRSKLIGSDRFERTVSKESAASREEVTYYADGSGRMLPMGCRGARLKCDETCLDGIVGCVIFLNVILLGIEIDYQWEGFKYIEDLCLAVYILDVVLRIRWEGFRTYFHDGAHYIDLFIVLASILELWIFPLLEEFMAGMGGHGTNSMVAKLTMALRGVRLLRALRLLKLVRATRPLFRILTSMVQAFQRVIWVIALIFIFIYIYALVFTQLLGRDVMGILQSPDEVVAGLQDKFYTVPGTLFELFRVICGDVTDFGILISAYQKSPLVILIYVSFQISTCWLALAIFSAQVVDSTITTTANESQKEAAEMSMQAHTKHRHTISDKLKEFLEPITTHQKMTFDEFADFLEDQDNAQKLEAIAGITYYQAIYVWSAIEEDGDLHKEEMLEGLLMAAHQDVGHSLLRLEAQLKRIQRHMRKADEVMIGVRASVLSDASQDAASIRQNMLSDRAAEPTAMLSGRSGMTDMSEMARTMRREITKEDEEAPAEPTVVQNQAIRRSLDIGVCSLDLEGGRAIRPESLGSHQTPEVQARRRQQVSGASLESAFTDVSEVEVGPQRETDADCKGEADCKEEKFDSIFNVNMMRPELVELKTSMRGTESSLTEVQSDVIAIRERLSEFPTGDELRREITESHHEAKSAVDQAVAEQSSILKSTMREFLKSALAVLQGEMTTLIEQARSSLGIEVVAEEPKMKGQLGVQADLLSELSILNGAFAAAADAQREQMANLQANLADAADLQLEALRKSFDELRAEETERLTALHREFASSADLRRELEVLRKDVVSTADAQRLELMALRIDVAAGVGRKTPDLTERNGDLRELLAGFEELSKDVASSTDAHMQEFGRLRNDLVASVDLQTQSLTTLWNSQPARPDLEDPDGTAQTRQEELVGMRSDINTVVQLLRSEKSSQADRLDLKSLDSTVQSCQDQLFGMRSDMNAVVQLLRSEKSSQDHEDPDRTLKACQEELVGMRSDISTVMESLRSERNSQADRPDLEDLDSTVKSCQEELVGMRSDMNAVVQLLRSDKSVTLGLLQADRLDLEDLDSTVKASQEELVGMRSDINTVVQLLRSEKSLTHSSQADRPDIEDLGSAVKTCQEELVGMRSDMSAVAQLLRSKLADSPDLEDLENTVKASQEELVGMRTDMNTVVQLLRSDKSVTAPSASRSVGSPLRGQSTSASLSTASLSASEAGRDLSTSAEFARSRASPLARLQESRASMPLSAAVSLSSTAKRPDQNAARRGASSGTSPLSLLSQTRPSQQPALQSDFRSSLRSGVARDSQPLEWRPESRSSPESSFKTTKLEQVSERQATQFDTSDLSDLLAGRFQR